MCVCVCVCVCVCRVCVWQDLTLNNLQILLYAMKHQPTNQFLNLVSPRGSRIITEYSSLFRLSELELHH